MSNCVRTASVHTTLIPVNRITYDGKKLLNDPVSEVDPEVYLIMENEKKRQRRGLELIASENFTSKAVNDALSSSLSNKYSEGYPGSRYYAGNEFIDQMERLCQSRALEVFGLDSEKWGVNVQPHSGSPANLAVYTALVEPHGRIMGLELSDGGHLSHGFYSPKKKVSASSIFFESLPYRVNEETGLIDYNKLEENALIFRPKLIIAGISCYPRWLDYARFRSICDKCDAYLMADISHISGLVAGGAALSPFEWADVVTTTTHKTLRGPRGAMIFYRKGIRYVNSKNENVLYDIGPKIDSAVFPGLQGGPHNHSIAGISVALKQCLTIQFAEYANQVIKNSQALANRLIKLGYKLTTDGTDNHLCLINLRLNGLDGSRIETILDLAHIACNKNTCPGDKNPFRPSGIRIGSPALTSRGFKEADFIQVAEFIHQAIEVYRKYDSKIGNTNKEFRQFIENDKNFIDDIYVVANEVEKFTSQFDIPGNEFF